MDDSGAASVRAIMHWQYRTICRGNHSILHNLYDLVGPKTHDYISFYGLRAYGSLFDGGPVATSQVHMQSSLEQLIPDCLLFLSHECTVRMISTLAKLIQFIEVSLDSK